MRRPYLTYRPTARQAAALLLTIGLGLVSPSCSRPEPLIIGTTELPFEVVEDAYLNMTKSFSIEGRDTIRRSLLMNGMGTAAILHQRFPEQSAAALASAEEYVRRLESGAEFAEEMARWAAETSAPAEVDLPKQPSPSAIGATVAATVAALEDGEWAGPLKTSYGWELVGLAERMEGVRNRAPVSLYRIQFPVGSAADRQQAEADWSALPLTGNAELIECLSLEFRHDRIAPQDK